MYAVILVLHLSILNVLMVFKEFLTVHGDAKIVLNIKNQNMERLYGLNLVSTGNFFMNNYFMNFFSRLTNRRVKFTM